MIPHTQGTLLDGRIRYDQPQSGYRTGIEPVLLAAAIPARRGQRVLEAGTGAGAGLLCLCTRIPGLDATGIERHPGMAELARHNAASNGLAPTILTSDVTTAALAPAYNHVFANPPWHDPASTRSPDPTRDAATHRDDSGLAAWVVALAAALAPAGTLTLILPASLAGEAAALLLAHRLGRLAIVPFWPRQGRPAKIILLQARAGQSRTTMHPGLVLHGEGAAYTEAADAILRSGAAFTI